MPDKLTMAEVWESLDPLERTMLAKMTGVEQGILALQKIETVLKAVLYRYHDHDIKQTAYPAHLAQQQALQQQALQQQLAYQKKQAHQNQTMGISNTTTTVSSTTPTKTWWVV